MNEVRSTSESRVLARAVAGTTLALVLTLATTLSASAAGHHARLSKAGLPHAGSTESAGNSMVGADFDPMNIKHYPPN